MGSNRDNQPSIRLDNRYAIIEIVESDGNSHSVSLSAGGQKSFQDGLFAGMILMIVIICVSMLLMHVFAVLKDD